MFEVTKSVMSRFIFSRLNVANYSFRFNKKLQTKKHLHLDVKVF